MSHPRITPTARTGSTQDTPSARTHTGEPTPDTASTSTRPSLTDLRHHLTTHLDPPARTWLDHALDEAAAHPGLHGPISVWELRLAEAGRRCGPAHADAARVLILDAARAGTDALTRVYFQGTAAGRSVPEDLHRVLDLTESVTPGHGTDHPHGKES